jgi:hypothetical protein
LAVAVFSPGQDLSSPTVLTFPIAGARFDELPAIKLPADPRFSMTGLEEMDPNWPKPLRAY